MNQRRAPQPTAAHGPLEAASAERRAEGDGSARWPDHDDESAPAPPSLRAVFEAEYGYVHKSLRRLGVAEADLVDQCQEVMLVVHHLLPDYDASRPIRPWLFAIAYRIACRYRSLARRRREVLFDEPADAPDHGPAPDELLETEQARAMVLEAIEAIDMLLRPVFILSEIEEEPMHEIAHALRIPINTGYSRLRLARRDFGKAMRRIKARRRQP